MFVSASALVDALQAAGEDFEWYPTTDRMVDAILADLSPEEAYPARIESFLDVGAGDGRVLMRLSQAHEHATLYAIEKSPILLAAAMSFPPGYQFTGTKTEITKQIGNAVVCVVAEALCGAMLDGASDRPSRRTEVA